MWYKLNKPKRIILLLVFFALGVGFFFAIGIPNQISWYWCFLSGSIFLIGLTLGIIVGSTIEKLIE